MGRLRRMEIFVAIAETGQFTRAADRVGVTKSAVSHAVSNLESYLGVQLLHRNAKGVILTDAGNDFFEHCNRIISDVNAMEESTRNVDSALRGRIKVTAPSTYATKHLVPGIAEFSEMHPDVDIVLDLSERKVDLIEETIDMAVRVSVMETFTALTRPLGSVKLNLCASPAFLKENPINRLTDLRAINCLKYSGMTVWRMEDENKRITSFHPKSKIIANNDLAIRELAIEGVGVCYIPDFVAEDAIDDGRLAVFELEGLTSLTLQSYALFPPNRHRPLRVRRLVEHLARRINPEPETLSA